MKETLGLITIALSIIGHTPYILDTFYGRTKPHVFTWFIWSVVTTLAFLGQLAKGGAAGAWGTGITGLMAITITILALRNKRMDITNSDRVFFGIAIIAIVLWVVTKDPTISVVIATFIDACAFLPTIRKTMKDPRSETFATYSLNILRHSLSLFALGSYNLATILYPAYLLTMNTVITIIMLRPKIKDYFRSAKND